MFDPASLDALSVGIGAGFGIVVTVVLTTMVRSVRIRRYREELARRTEERSVELAGMAAKTDLLSWRITELQEQHDQLLAKRDEALGELSQVSHRTDELRTKARRSKETLARLSEQLVVLPELDDLAPVDEQR